MARNVRLAVCLPFTAALVFGASFVVPPPRAQ